MRSSFRKSLVISFLALIVLNGCTTTASSPALITADAGNAHIRTRFEFHLKDLEKSIHMSYKGKTVHIAAPIAASYQDWRKMPVASIRGREQGGLTSWKVLGGSTSVYLAHWKGVVPDWLIRHEALHVILLSHGITGHPVEYASMFGHAYWWLPEEFFLERNKAKVASIPDENEELTAACPLCKPFSGSLRNRRP
jgi:hypothetical protein